MKFPIAYVDLRFSAHATEDLDKVKKAVFNLFPEDRREELNFRVTVAKGHHGNPITFSETRIKDRGLIETFIETISTGLSELDKETILREFHLFVEKCNLYLRLDKQAAFQGEVKLHNADPIHIRVHFTRRNEKSIMEICRDLGLTP